MSLTSILISLSEKKKYNEITQNTKLALENRYELGREFVRGVWSSRINTYTLDSHSNLGTTQYRSMITK